MDWKDYVIIGGAVFLLFGGGLYTHYKRKGSGNVSARPTTGPAFIDDVRRLATAVSTVGGKAMSEGGKLARDGAMMYVARTEKRNLHLSGTP